MNLESFVNTILTSGINTPDPETARKIKFLNIFGVVLLVVAPILGFFYYNIEAILLSHTLMVTGLMGLGVILFLRITKNPMLVGNIAVLVLWATLLAIKWNTGAMATGGLILLSWVWNAALILLAIFMTGYLCGTIWACLVFIESGVAVFLLRSGHEFTNLIPDEISPIYSLGSYLIGLLAVLLIAFLFEKERHEAMAREVEKSETMRDLMKYTDDILERSPVPTFVVDRNHRVLQWNKACQEFTGISSEEIFGKNVCDSLFVDEEGSLVDKYLNNPDEIIEEYGDSIVSQSESGSFALEAILPNMKGGVAAIINTAPILDRDGSVKGAIQTIQDVSNRSLGGGSQVLRENPDSDLNPIFRVNNKGKISIWNKGCEERFGYAASQMIGSTPLQLLSKPYRSNFRETIINSLKGESFFDKEWKYYTSNGEALYVLASVLPIRSPSGKVQECAIVSSDITRVKTRVRKLERYAADCKERLNKLQEEYDLLQRNIASFIRKK